MTFPAAPDPSTVHVPVSPLRAIAPAHGYHYLVSTPRTDPDTTKTRGALPLIVFLHGAAERGTQVEDVARQGLPRLLSPSAELTPAERELGREIASRFIVVAPQCAHYEVWDEPTLLTLVDHLLQEHPVDAKRVYLTGMSLGGFGVWTLGLRHPHRFAALVPICGGGRVADVQATARSQFAALARVGIWAFHGERDIIVPLEESTRMVDALKSAGLSDVRLTVYPEGGHDAWTPAYGNPELYRWLLTHVRR